jgi:FMN phosphatase YigB (HAD superfamily)
VAFFIVLVSEIRPMGDLRPLLFVDFHGTISDSVYWNTLSEGLLSSIQGQMFANPSFIADWMRGWKSSGDACDYAAEVTGLPAEDLHAELLQSCAKIEIREDVLNSLRIAKERFRTVLITANMDCFKLVVQSLGLEAVFDRIVVSSDYGLLKEDGQGRLFKHVASTCGGELQTAVLLDDSPKVCRTFSRLGGRAIQVTGPSSMAWHLAML